MPTYAVSLAGETIDHLQHYFTSRNHHPSAKMWAALAAVAQTMERMAEGRCPPAVYVSSLDPGVGKTSTLIHFLRTLLASPNHDHAAALVCVGRKEQIEAIVAEADLAPTDYAVLTSEPKLNALGCGRPAEARVLFTTHAMVEKRTEAAGGAFAKAGCFHYQRRPRAVRIWDEAILPGQTLTLRRADLAGLLPALCGRHPALSATVERLFIDLMDAADGTPYRLPDIAEAHGPDLSKALAPVAGNAEAELTMRALWFLGGKVVTVRQDGKYGEIMLDYRDTLPEDIKPLLVLDASARVRTTYTRWEADRGGIVLLPGADKSYDALTINVWSRGGGKASWRKDGATLIEGIARTIMTKPEEEWLVIHHLGGVDMDFEKELRARLPRMFGPTVHYRNWGRHDATNAFVHVRNIILAGTLFMRPAHYESLGRLASAYPSARGRYDPEKTRAVTLGEHRHMILQALCRGAVRQCVGDSCPPAHAYIIAATGTGIAADLPLVFPGAAVLPWKPVEVPLSGVVKDAFEFIVGELASKTSVTFRTVMTHLGWHDRGNFKRRVRHHADFVEAIAAEGIVETHGTGKHLTAFCRA
jgi:hypothetical protein